MTDEMFRYTLYAKNTASFTKGGEIMGMKIYLTIGLIFEILVLRSYIKANVPYTKFEIWLGAVIDVFAWPIVLLRNIINCFKGES